MRALRRDDVEVAFFADRAALDFQAEFPGIQTNACFRFARLVAEAHRPVRETVRESFSSGELPAVRFPPPPPRRENSYGVSTAGAGLPGGSGSAAKDASSPVHAALRYAWRAYAKLADQSASVASSE